MLEQGCLSATLVIVSVPEDLAPDISRETNQESREQSHWQSLWRRLYRFIVDYGVLADRVLGSSFDCHGVDWSQARGCEGRKLEIAFFDIGIWFILHGAAMSIMVNLP